MVALRAIVAFAAVLQGAGAVSTLRRVAVEADGDDKAAAAPTGVGKATLAPGGLETSRIGYGGLHFAALDGPETLQKLLHACLDNGITMLDLADIYGYNKSAELVGKTFKLEPGLREKFQINYKTGIVFPEQPQHLDASGAYLKRAVDIALNQLNTDYIDILMPHAPDPLLNAAEVVATFKELKKAGKVRWFGVSNFSPSQVELLRAAFEKEGLVLGAAELEISALTPTALYDGRLDQLQRVGMSPLGWGPLGGDPMGGVNRLFNFDGDRQLRIRKALKGVAQELGPDVTEDQVAIAWLLKHPANIIPVLGTTKVERINAQAKAVGLELTRTQWTAIMGASASAKYSRWEQLNDGQWHDVANDLQTNTYGSPLGVDTPVGFCDWDSCKMPGGK